MSKKTNKSDLSWVATIVVFLVIFSINVVIGGVPNFSQSIEGSFYVLLDHVGYTIGVCLLGIIVGVILGIVKISKKSSGLRPRMVFAIVSILSFGLSLAPRFI